MSKRFVRPPMPNLTHIGPGIRARREALGLSLRDLAALTGGAVSHSTIGRIETGARDALVSNVDAIHAALCLAEEAHTAQLVLAAAEQAAERKMK